MFFNKKHAYQQTNFITTLNWLENVLWPRVWISNFVLRSANKSSKMDIAFIAKNDNYNFKFIMSASAITIIVTGKGISDPKSKTLNKAWYTMISHFHKDILRFMLDFSSLSDEEIQEILSKEKEEFQNKLEKNKMDSQRTKWQMVKREEMIKSRFKNAWGSVI